MGKIIKRNVWPVITAIVLAVVAFGSYHVYEISAATRTNVVNYLVANSGTDVGTETTNAPAGTQLAVSAIGLTSTTSPGTTSSSARPAGSAGDNVMSRWYSPVLSTANHVDLSAITAAFNIRTPNTGDSWTFHIYDYDPATGTRTLIAQSNTINTLTAGTTTTVNPTYTIQNGGRVQQNHRAVCEVTTNLTAAVAASGNWRQYYNFTTSFIQWTETDASVDTTPPTVTINQAGGQADPTSTSPINFTVVFSEATTNFATGDVTISGTAGGAKTATVTGSGTTYNVAVTGMTTAGTVIASIGAGVATDAAGNGNTASTSTDNSVSWTVADTTPPTVTINQAGGQADPTSTSPINFTVVFSEATTNFATGDVTISGTAGGTKTATVTGSGTTYNVAVTGMTTAGTVIASIGAGVATDAAGNGNTASTSTDNSVSWTVADTTPPTVTINQAGGQADPTSTSPINFAVVFSEATTNFATGDVTISGTAGGTKTATVTGSGTTYNVAVTGMTTAGTVIASIGAGVATDAAGNGNTASTSTDNSVSWTVASCVTGPQTLTIAPSSSSVLPSGVATYTVTISNGDTGTCTDRPYTLTRGTPSNATDFVTSALSKTALLVPAGGIDSATYTVTANAGAANGVQNTVAVSTTGTTPTSVSSTTTVTTFYSPLMHNQSNTQSTKNGSWGNNKDCSWCHTDTTTNIKRVAQSIIPTWTATARNVIFNKITSSVPGYMGTMGNDGRSPNTTSTNVCEVCHTQTKYHQYSAVGTTPPVALDHYNNKDCVTCHAHNKAFKASCAGCHLATPTSGSHTAHAVTKAMLCATCHVNAVGTGTAHNNTIHSLGFQINGTNVPGFAGDATTRFATYSASTSSPAQSTQVNTSVSTSAAGRGSCNLYCHGNWTGAGGTLNPVWGGGATQDACGTCHAATITPNQPTAWPTTGAHARHAGSAANQMKLSCDKCHGVHTDASHVTGTVKFDVSGISGTAQYRATTGTTSYAITGATAALAPSATYGQCTNMYCHSSAQNPTTGSASGTVYAAPTWATTPTLTCGDCHSNMKTVGATGGSLSSHNEHANAATNNYDCGVCHAGYNATTAAYPAHVNSAVDVTISATYGGTYNGGTALNNGYSTCSNTYCHSNGTNTVTPAANTSVAWGGTSTCSSCHGFPPAYTSGSPKANSHVQHVTTGGYTCDYCHVKTTATGSTIASRVRHANMFYNVSGNTAKLTVANFTYASAGKSCSTSQCHTAVMTWGSNSTANTCTKCHGTLTTAAVVTNAQMAPSTNAHQAHVHGAASYSYSSELTCYECHNSGVTANFTGHMDGTPAVVFTNASTAGANGTATNWASPAKTCSVYCHGVAMPKGDTGGTGRTPAWTNAAYMSGVQANDCSRCHGFPPTTGTTVTTHASYVAQPNSCTTCHVHFNNTNGFATEADRRLHIDGVVQAKGDCNSCHDYDTVGAVYTTSWSGGYWGKSPQASPNGYGDHAKHINYIKTRLSIVTDLNPVSQVYGAAGSENLKVCGTCHTTLAADHMAGGRMIFSQSVGNHPFLMGGSGGTSLLFGATNPAYNAGAKTCSNLSCHYFTTPTW